jgi:hypothetical protein
MMYKTALLAKPDEVLILRKIKSSFCPYPGTICHGTIDNEISMALRSDDKTHSFYKNVFKIKYNLCIIRKCTVLISWYHIWIPGNFPEMSVRILKVPAVATTKSVSPNYYLDRHFEIKLRSKPIYFKRNLMEGQASLAAD